QEYLQAVHNTSYRDRLYRVIAKHASEWYYGRDDPLWKSYLDTLTTDAPLWKTYLETFLEKMTWMKAVSEKGVALGPEVWHMHPVVFLDALGESEDGMALKWLKVDKGQVTFDAEGNDTTGSRYFSRRIHWPGNDLSGVTLGRGYDMGGRSKDSVYSDMVASGIDSDKANKISMAAGLKGSAAMNFVLSNRESIGEITRMQQNKLFGLIYPAYVVRANGNYETKTHGEPSALPWDSLEQKIQDILVDFIYQGFSGERPMRAGMHNSRQELISYIENNTTISSYENGRHRANYLRGQ
ncbi:pesticin C-terminus-like muramidase, partial [Siccibacter turicensis]|uniref:pesticin C-terminus-like muramidase n=1 Tax=Siccibacter turicensis TaxID=357233 RepID=UPI003F556C64